MTSAKGEAGAKGQEAMAKAVWLFRFSEAAAVGRGNTLAHCRIMPLKNSFISCLLFTTKHSSCPTSRLPLAPPSTPLAQPQHFVIYN